MDLALLIARIDEYSATSGLKHSTICRYAFGDARAYDRMKKRLDQVEDHQEKLESFIAKNEEEKGAA